MYSYAAVYVVPRKKLAEFKELPLKKVFIGGREFFVTGHLEYAPNTLDKEYKRDMGKRDDVELPENYYFHDDPNEQDSLVTWRAHANLFYSNWINYYVYQETPYNIEDILLLLL